MPSGAELSACGTYRYRLWRAWGDGPRLGWIMLNPSTADAMKDDPTIRRCIRFAARDGYQGIEVCNLFALRATDPRELSRHFSPTGDPENLSALLRLTERCKTVVCAWGAKANRERIDRVLSELDGARAALVCLGTTQAGAPRHPLYVRSYKRFEDWKPLSQGRERKR